MTLSGANSYTGPTTVRAGTLAINAIGSLGTNTLEISTAGAAKVLLNYSGSRSVGVLTFDGVAQAGGTWGGAGSGAAHVDTNHFAAGAGTITSAVPPAPVASFSASATNAVALLPVTFTDTSAGTITNRFWDFGDGNTTNTTTNVMAHTYTVAGSNTVKLIVSGPGGTSTNWQAIVVTTPPPPPEFLPDNAVSLNPGTGAASLTFVVSSGYWYRVIYRDSLLATNAWQPVKPPEDGWHTATNSEPTTVTDPGAASSTQRFYRIEAQ